MIIDKSLELKLNKNELISTDITGYKYELSPKVSNAEKKEIAKILTLKFPDISIQEIKIKTELIYNYIKETYTIAELQSCLKTFLYEYKLDFGTSRDHFNKVTPLEIFPKQDNLIELSEIKKLYKENPYIWQEIDKIEINNEIVYLKKPHNYDISKFKVKEKRPQLPPKTLENGIDTQTHKADKNATSEPIATKNEYLAMETMFKKQVLVNIEQTNKINKLKKDLIYQTNEANYYKDKNSKLILEVIDVRKELSKLSK